jgi:CRP/FNR family nitrogen fixation transcriptional regulator
VLAALAEQDKEVAGRLSELLPCELKRAQTHSTLLILNAKERVAKFLLEMASRNPKSTKLELPMSRLDIADYLGLTIETVSRVLRKFEDAAAIARPSARDVVLRDRGQLRPALNRLYWRPNQGYGTRPLNL